MRLLSRYIFRETLTPGLIALLALTFVIFTREVGALLEVMVRRSAGGAELLQLALAVLPNALVFTIPMAVLVGILTGLSRLSSDSEAVALRACGVPMSGVLRPVLAMAAIAFAASAVLTLVFAPDSAARLRDLKYAISAKQVSIDVRPRVFNEDLGNFILYVQDVETGGNSWKGIFLADMRKPDEPKVTFAERGRLVYSPMTPTSAATFEITLSNGSTHIVAPNHPETYSFSRFDISTIPIPVPDPPDRPTEIAPSQMPTRQLAGKWMAGGASYEERVEFHRRVALPFACIAFALVGVPLGITTRRGGRSMGLVLSLLLMLGYYLLFAGGTRIAGNAQLAPFVGAWLGNIACVVLGMLLLIRSNRSDHNRGIGALSSTVTDFLQRVRTLRMPRLSSSGRFGVSSRPKWIGLLDFYVLRGFGYFFALVLMVFVSLFVIVTLFELLPDIVKNNVDTIVVVRYFLFLMPQILYYVIPLTVLLAVLINLGTLTKSNEVLAVKAGAISLYRLAMPLVLVGVLLSMSIYLVQDFMLPYANQRQDEFRNVIKGRAPQTYRDPQRKWMVGSGSKIYNYNFFEPNQNILGGISVFEFSPDGFDLTRWTHASRAHWDAFEHEWFMDGGWIRQLGKSGVTYAPFENLAAGPEIDPPEYFRKEVRTAAQMSYGELTRYVAELQNSGFDVNALLVDLYRKLSFPMVSMIMAIIGVPFSFKTGKRGAFYGIGLCVIVGIVYWSTFELFDKLGGVGQLSPMIAAWFPNIIFASGGLWMFLRVRT